MLLNAAKDVASALGALINATKNASGKPNSDPATEVLKTTGKVLFIGLKEQRNYTFEFLFLCVAVGGS